MYRDFKPCYTVGGHETLFKKKKQKQVSQNKYLCFSVLKHTFLVQILTLYIYFSVIFKVMESFEMLGYNTSVSFKRKQTHPHMGV